MSLKILTNTAYANCARILTANSGGTEITSSADQLECQKLTGGHFHYYHLAGTNEDRKFIYVNPANTLSADWLIMPTMSAYITTTNVKAYKYATYPGSATSMYNGSPFSATLYGPNSQDFITSVSASAQDALEVEITQATTRPANLPLRKIYFCTDYTLNYPQGASYRGLPLNSRFAVGKQYFNVIRQWQFAAEALTRTEVQSLQQLPFLRTDLFFIYDSTGGLITFRLLPCVLESLTIQATFDNLFNIQMSVMEVETYQ